MDDFRRSINKQLEDPEYQIMRAMIAARTEAGMTQQELSKRTVINLSNLSRIENGNPSPHFFASHPHREALDSIRSTPPRKSRKGSKPNRRMIRSLSFDRHRDGIDG